MNANIAHWHDALDLAASLARGPRFGRLLFHPCRYLSAIAFRYFIYPLRGRPWSRKCRTFFKAEMQVALPAGMDLFLLGCKTHDSELRLAKYFLRTIQPGDVVVDVGAHFGYFSLLAAALAGAKGRVIAFEPAFFNFEVLSRNIAPFQQIEAHRIVLSNRERAIEFWEFPPLYSEYNTTRPEAVPQHLQGTRAELPAVSFDAFAVRNGISPGLVKIDVEGAEWEVLQGMELLLAGSNPPVVVMEYLGGDGQRSAMSHMVQNGFTAFVPDDEGALQPCMDIEADMARRGIDSENVIFQKIANFVAPKP